MPLEPGLHAEHAFEVAGPLTTDVGGAAAGSTCVASATLREIVDGRKLRFDVEVREGDRTIGVGTHERRIIKRG